MTGKGPQMERASASVGNLSGHTTADRHVLRGYDHLVVWLRVAQLGVVGGGDHGLAVQCASMWKGPGSGSTTAARVGDFGRQFLNSDSHRLYVTPGCVGGIDDRSID